MAHFAHYGLGGKSECEFYFPGTGIYHSTERNSPSDTSTSRNIRSVGSTGRAALCLTFPTQRSGHLYLRLPIVRPSPDLTGHITLKSALGEKTILFNSLATTSFCAIPWRRPPATCTASPGLEWLSTQVTEALSQFQFSGNYFRATQVGGLLLDSGMSLETGTSYWLVTQKALPQTLAPSGLKISEPETLRGWHFYELTLPPSDALARQGTREALERYLDRPVVDAWAKASIRHPQPHHYDSDGIAVYGEETTNLVVNRPKGSRLDVRAITDDASTIETEDAHPEMVEVSGLGVGDFSVLIDGVTHGEFRIRLCEPYRPYGVRIVANQAAFELFEAGARTVLRTEPSSAELTVPVHRAWAVIRVSGSMLSLSSNLRSFHLSEGIREIEAGGFGSIALADATLVQHANIAPEVDQELLTSLSGIVLRQAGIEAVGALRRLRPDAGACAKWAHTYNIEWLYPQVVKLMSSRRVG
jgi:hypothetical protein